VAVRDILVLSSEVAPCLPAHATLPLRRDAARALLTDFSESVQAAREQSGWTVGSVNTQRPRSSRLPAEGGLCFGDFPSLPTSSRVTKISGGSRKRITPSRVPDNVTNRRSPRFGDHGVSAARHELNIEHSLHDTRKANMPRQSSGASSSLDCVTLDEAPPVDLQPLLELKAVKRGSSMHAAFIFESLSADHTTVDALMTLVEALSLWSHCPRSGSFAASPARGMFARLGTAYTNPAHFCAHAVLSLVALEPFLSLLPPPILTGLAVNPVLSKYASISFLAKGQPASFPTTAEKRAFTPSQGVSGFVDVDFQPREVQAASGLETVPRRLSANLEASWDMLIDLQRIYRGDNSRIPAGSLDRDASMRTVANLHPANADAFADRVLDLLLSTAAREDESDRRRRLSLRMTASRDPSAYSRAGRLSGYHKSQSSVSIGPETPSHISSGQSMGVVLHRVPTVVRALFPIGSAEAFFLDFVDIVDSAKLSDAMMPRLSSSLHSFLTEAASATNDESFTDSVLQARLTAKLLSVTMHSSNWAHSSRSLTGDVASASERQRANKLPPDIVRMRATICCATWNSCVNLANLLRQAVAWKHGPSVLAVLVVADVTMRVAAVDPISSGTNWYTTCVNGLYAVLQDCFKFKDKKFAWLARIPLVRLTVENILSGLEVPHSVSPSAETNARRDEVADTLITCLANGVGDASHRFGDERLLSTCLPRLADLRRTLNVLGAPRVQSSVKPRRIRPSAATESPQVSEQQFGTSFAGAGLVQGVTRATATGLTSEVNMTECFRPEQHVVGQGVANLPKIHGELWHTFQRGLDKRVRDVACLVLGKRGLSRDDCVSHMKQAAELLLPDVPLSIVEVTAQHCAHSKHDALIPDESRDAAREELVSTSSASSRELAGRADVVHSECVEPGNAQDDRRHVEGIVGDGPEGYSDLKTLMSTAWFSNTQVELRARLQNLRFQVGTE
jgi:hypothetical protein